MEDTIDNSESIGPSLPTENGAVNFEGDVKEFQIINGFPMYQEGHVLDGRCQIFERIGWDDRMGPTYLAMGPEGKELVLRMGNEKTPIVQMEAAFICKAEQDGEWPKFSQVHSIFHVDEWMVLALYFRGGPTLEQCFEFSKKNFSHGSAARLAEDILQIMRTVHNMGYMMRSLDLDEFHFDAASRHLFMADISSLRKSTDKDGKKLPITWTGCLLFAPLAASVDTPIENGVPNARAPIIHERDEVEAWFYMFVYLVNGLPWDGESAEDLKWDKAGTVDDKLFDGLPNQYKKIFDIIHGSPSDKPITDAEYQQIQLLVKEIYQQVGGIVDHEENFDFERDPTEDELPRFVAERVPLSDDTPNGNE